MKNSTGTSFIVTIFGESHGPYIGAIIDGIAPGIALDFDNIDQKLSLRRPSGKISTARVEADQYQIISGVVNGVTTGTPLTVIIPNSNTKPADYETLKNTPRPSHADYTATLKYHGYQNASGGGHFSGRITAALVFVGAIAMQILQSHGIKVGSHILRCGQIEDVKMSVNDIDSMNQSIFAVIDENVKEKMLEKIEEAANNKDSIGGVVETMVAGLDGGIGEPFFDSLEGVIAKNLFAVPAVKGVEFGDGFELAEMLGSQANDPFEFVDGKVVTSTNHNGGINGGISNGMPLVIKTAVKPTPSIYQKQNTVDLKNGCNTELEIKGRHDPAIVHRARVVIDSAVAISLVDMCSMRYGTDWQVK